jgi:hypothetical protein
MTSEVVAQAEGKWAVAGQPVDANSIGLNGTQISPSGQYPDLPSLAPRVKRIDEFRCLVSGLMLRFENVRAIFRTSAG